MDPLFEPLLARPLKSLWALIGISARRAQKGVKKGVQNDPKIPLFEGYLLKKGVKNGSKMGSILDPKITYMRLFLAQKWAQNGSKRGQKWVHF